MQVTDQNGCTALANVTLLNGAGSGNVVVQPAGPFTSGSNPFQLQANGLGGVWSANCGSCVSSSGLFSPSISGLGTFQICYTTSGPCGSSDCITVIVGNCPPQTTQENRIICPGTETAIFGQQEDQAGTYSATFIDVNGCDSTHTIVLTNYPTNSTQGSFLLCEGDSVNVYGNWIYDNFYEEQIVIDTNGCFVTNSTTIIVENCEIEPFSLVIPNVFTPNSDNVNDLFSIDLIGGILDKGFIVNRWGTVMVNFDDKNRTWNGKTKEGFTAVDGVYTYVVFYTPIGKKQERAQGFVTLVR